MTGLQCFLGDREELAEFQGPGVILFHTTVGIPAFRDSPHGLRVYLSVREQRSKYTLWEVRGLDKSIPTETPIRVSVGLPDVTPAPPAEQPPSLPPMAEPVLRKMYERLDRRFSRKKPPELPPVPEPGEALSLGRCSHCIAVRKNGRPLATTGTPEWSMVKITLTVPEGGESTCVLELIGGEGKKSCTWGSSPLSDGDGIALGFLGDAVPDPVQIVPPDPHAALRFAVAMFSALGRHFRKKEPGE